MRVYNSPDGLKPVGFKPLPQSGLTQADVIQAKTLYATDDISSLTDKAVLMAIMVINKAVKTKYAHHPLCAEYVAACLEFRLAKARYLWLTRLIVKTPPVTPQLNLFI
jgi:hypothetical protein